MADGSTTTPGWFAPGRTVLRREVLHGRPWMEQPVTVVHDGDAEAHAAWRFFDLQGVATHWYVNVQLPVVRHVVPGGGGAFETADLGIDIVFAPDGGRWEWKDVDDPDRMVASGRITADERDRIRAEAAVVAGRLDAGARWWAPWDDWHPGDPPPLRAG